MYILSRFLGVNLILLLVFGYLSMSGRRMIYLDIPSAVFVVGLLLGGLMISFRPGELLDALALGIVGPTGAPVSCRRRRVAAAVFGRAYQLAWGAGLVATLFSLIAMLADLSDPAAIGAGMAVALLSTAYGALFAEFLFAPLQQSVLNTPTHDPDSDADGGGSDHGDENPTLAGGPSTGLWRGVAVVAVLIAVFLVPIVSFSEIKKEDQLRPDEEARYLRYLYGDASRLSPIAKRRLGELDPVLDSGR